MDNYDLEEGDEEFTLSQSMNEDEQTAIEIVDALVNVGVKLVCIDFDATFLSIHTGGMWEQSASELQHHVRPLFHQLIPLVLEAHMYAAVVTFSPQVELIRHVLELCFDAALANQIIIRGDDTSWSISTSDCHQFNVQTETIRFSRDVKLPYIVSAAIDACHLEEQRLNERDDDIMPIQNSHTVLIDDDQNNIRHAHDHGISGIWFGPDQETDLRSLCHSIKRLQVQEEETGDPDDERHSPLKSDKEGTTDNQSASLPVMHRTPASEQRKIRAGKRKKFNFCTPSPIFKVKFGQTQRVNPKKPIKMRCSRNMEDALNCPMIQQKPATPSPGAQDKNEKFEVKDRGSTTTPSTTIDQGNIAFPV